MTARSLREESIVRGESWQPSYKLQDAEGTALNLSLATVSVQLRLRNPVTGTSLTRTNGVSGEETLTNGGTDGLIQFFFSAVTTTTLPLGRFELELIFVDTAPNPDFKARV